MNLSLASLWLALTVTLGPGPTSVTLEAGAALALELPGPGPGRLSGLATPLGYVLWPEGLPADSAPYARWEELQHVEQWTALGPGFVLVYLLTMGEALEPYTPRDPRSPYDPSSMWAPDARRCPMVRMDRAGLAVWPCWRGWKGE